MDSIAEYTNADKNIQKILIGNKCDLNRDVQKEEGQKLAEHFNIPFFEVSAKDNTNVNEFMNRIIEDVYTNLSHTKNGVKLNEDDISKKKKCSC